MNNVYEQLTVKDVANWVASGAIIFGGIIPYVPQYREIKKRDNAEGFSLYVCLALLIANTLRIFFWFGKHYELPLLLQSIFMIITMFIMIKLCINVQNRNQIIKAREHVFADFDANFFWKWTNFQSYLDFMLLFAALVGILTYLLVNVPIYVETVGLLAVLTEAMLGIPQFLCNISNKSTNGMSINMVTMWTLGDAFKTGYFIIKEAPIQFGICGTLQVIIDIAILAQVYIYRNSTGVHVRVPIRTD
ncbi:solute carrier family 66 member 2 [Hylaeus anthracinus]|uniref:solute carrier family 66 member 2 n=1 Tax=Hylaeus volcanicus TaxID=313075 RepID=UPI0023B7F992|nr:solute carrier family 66 member 2 [Hylaeus volcanicus]XP_053985131.1 solute carrier family 66 member 2 [Hylaeus volcanicus]XP_054010507.1 solute carrier family 66 member 2 [Hylaeus anthracinus]XP_054010508.1 solute carrier family 66 member 2 [Hylaeus anthracinus]